MRIFGLGKGKDFYLFIDIFRNAEPGWGHVFQRKRKLIRSFKVLRGSPTGASICFGIWGGTLFKRVLNLKLGEGIYFGRHTPTFCRQGKRKEISLKFGGAPSCLQPLKFWGRTPCVPPPHWHQWSLMYWGGKCRLLNFPRKNNFDYRMWTLHFVALENIFI